MINHYKKYVKVPLKNHLAAPIKKHLITPLLRILCKKKIQQLSQKPPILIGGCGRSGTTMLLSMFASHPRIFGLAHETSAFSKWEKKTCEKGVEYKMPKEYHRFLRYLTRKKVPASCVRFCEKTPANIRYIPEILEHYNGKVKIIHLLRDGRDVLTSKHPTNPNKYWVSPSRYIQDVQSGLEYQSHPSVYTVKYEDLVENYEETMRDLCLFIEEDFCSEIKDWSSNTSVTKNRAWSDKVIPHHTKSLRKWEKPEYKERVNEIMTDKRVVNLLKKLSY